VINIHPTARVSLFADLEDSVRGSLISIGEDSVIDSFVKIKPAGGLGDLIIGSRTIINSGCVIYTGHGIVIGSDVAIAANCTFSPVNHEYLERNKLIKNQGFKPSKGGIVIEDDVWIGANSVLLDGAHLGRGCVIGAGSIVRGKIEPFSVNVGHPLRIIGWRK